MGAETFAAGHEFGAARAAHGAARARSRRPRASTRARARARSRPLTGGRRGRRRDASRRSPRRIRGGRRGRHRGRGRDCCGQPARTAAADRSAAANRLAIPAAAKAEALATAEHVVAFVATLSAFDVAAFDARARGASSRIRASPARGYEEARRRDRVGVAAARAGARVVDRASTVATRGRGGGGAAADPTLELVDARASAACAVSRSASAAPGRRTPPRCAPAPRSTHFLPASFPIGRPARRVERGLNSPMFNSASRQRDARELAPRRRRARGPRAWWRSEPPSAATLPSDVGVRQGVAPSPDGASPARDDARARARASRARRSPGRVDTGPWAREQARDEARGAAPRRRRRALSVGGAARDGRPARVVRRGRARRARGGGSDLGETTPSIARALIGRATRDAGRACGAPRAKPRSSTTRAPLRRRANAVIAAMDDGRRRATVLEASSATAASGLGPAPGRTRFHDPSAPAMAACCARFSRHRGRRPHRVRRRSSRKPSTTLALRRALGGGSAR